jgi:preprotein translocase subunit SecE
MWNYFKEVRAEMKHVSWPTRRVTVIYTSIVVGVSLGVAIYLGILDYLFSMVIRHLI